MDKNQENQAQKWCESNGWTDMFIQSGEFYAFPPSAVIPQPLTESALLQTNSYIPVSRNMTNGTHRKYLLFVLGLVVRQLTSFACK